jgi:hypothetical protein
MIQTWCNVAKYLERKIWYTINNLGIGNKKTKVSQRLIMSQA